MKTSAVQPGTTSSPSRPNRLLLRGGEVAAMLGISRALAFKWMQEGVLPTVRITGARTVRVPRVALLEWIEQNTGAGLAPQSTAAERVTHAAVPTPTSRRGGARNAIRA